MNGRAPSSGWRRCSTPHNIRSVSSKSSSIPTATWPFDKLPPSISRTSSPRIGLPITTAKYPFHPLISFSSEITCSSLSLSFLLSSGCSSVSASKQSSIRIIRSSFLIFSTGSSRTYRINNKSTPLYLCCGFFQENTSSSQMKS
ncbi:hypothetical protein VIGAN_01111300, partial [Vigna angularis var. angularis]